jgi:hydroxymethylpyrimidine pyrophosphatase-like HAD family hydrolase
MKILDVRAPAICENGAVLYSLEDNWARYAPGVQEQIGPLREVRAFIENELLPQYEQALLQFGKEAQISVFSKRPESLAPMREQVEEFVRRRGGPRLRITMSHYYLNISLAGADKGSTLRLLLKELGVTKEQSAGIGDTEGDLPLRDAVGFFAAPANAQEVIKRVADYVSPYPMLRGVLDILGQAAMRRG